MKKLDIEEYKEFFKLYGYTIIEEVKIGKKIKHSCFDKDGYKYLTIKTSLKRGETPEIVSKFNPFSIHNIKRYIDLNELTCELVSNTYKGANEKWVFKCECGRLFKWNWRQFYGQCNGKCKKCNCESQHKEQKIDFKTVKSTFEQKGYILLGDNYIRNNIGLPCIDYNGYRYKISYSKIKTAQSFAIVHKGNPFSIDNIKTYIINEGLKCKLISKKYISTDANLEFICECGEHFKMSWASLINKKRRVACKKCIGAISSLELKTQSFLDGNGYSYEPQYKFIGLNGQKKMSIDFLVYLDSGMYGIEADGIQHFEIIKSWGGEEGLKERQIRDKYTDNYCLNNNIFLLRLPYYDFCDNAYIEKLEKYLKNN